MSKYSASTKESKTFASDAAYRITPEQERLWLEWKLKPEGHAYNVNLQSKITGPLNRERLYAAMEASAEYFETFRSHFDESANGVWQIIAPQIDDFITYHDLSHDKLDIESAETLALVLLKHAVQKPFDLKTPPLIRYTLIRCSENLHYFSFVAPHIFCDYGSANTILQFVSQAYNTGPKHCMAHHSADNEGIVADYFEHTTNYYSNSEKTAAQSYWKSATAGIQPKVHFRHFQPAAAISDKGERQYFNLSSQQMQSLKAIARQHRTTPFSVLLAAFNSLLYRYFGQTDLTVAYPVNMRPAHLRRLPHFFTNTLPLRVQLNGQMPFGELINAITSARKSDRPHQALSYGEIIKAMRSNGVAYKDAKLNVTFAQTHFGLESFDFAGCEALQIPPVYTEVSSDLTLVYDVNTPPYLCAFEYKTDIFNAQTIHKMTEHFLQLLSSVFADPQLTLDAIPLLRQQQIHQIVTREAIAHTCFDESLIHQGFERQSRITPAATAVVTTAGEELTYQELEQKANGLAYVMRKQGVQAGDRVAILQPRSLEQIISVLAILKAGAVYVPINPDQPDERILTMLAKSVCSFVLLHAETANMSVGQLPQLVVAHETLPNLEHSCALPSHKSEESAYILFTSGSTNVPNGVQVSHHNVMTRLAWYSKTLSIQLHETVLNRINLWFDPSVYEIFGTLATGARLVIPTEYEIRDTQQFIALLDRYSVNVTNTVPSQLTNLLRHLADNQLADLRCMIAGGEALQPKIKQQFRSALPKTQLLNMYGPTECTIMATCEDCSHFDSSSERISIGHAIDHTEVHIYTPAMQIQPVGAEGEICISGPGVAQGYSNNSALTRERFVPHPYVPNVSLYRSGDIGYKAADGEIFFLGRRDHQVKLRGNRIELSEIERAMHRLFELDAVAVLMKQPENKLVAYIAGAHGCTAAHMRQQLESVLPAYMIPAEYVRLPALPLTTNGKIDRQLLPSLDATPLPQTEIKQSLSSFELQLAAIWAETLQIPLQDIDPDVTFFDLGGDSFETVNLAAQLEIMLNRPLPAELIFEYPTLRKLAAKLDETTPAPSPVTHINERRAAMQNFKPRSLGGEK